MRTTSRLSCPPRFGTQRTPERPTLGPKIAEVARRLGKPLMPWQQYVADVLGEIDPLTGQLAYSEFGLTVPRQSGKSTFILAKFVHRGLATQFFGPRQQMVYTAQTRKKAREKWKEDYVAEIEAAPVFSRRITASYGSGDEHLRFPNKSRLSIEANTEKAGHGGTLDEGYIDEAFAQQDARLEQAFGPAMITRRNTQLGWVSTAGWQHGSPYLAAKVRHARQQVEMGVREGLAYFEWSAPEDADPLDPLVWRGCMPAMGHTISEAKIAAVLRKHESEGKLADFRRAYLNQWVPKPIEGADTSVVPGWGALADPGASRGPDPIFGVDVAEDRTAAVAVSWRRPDGLWHVEMTGDPFPAHALVERCAALVARFGGRAAVPSSLREEFERARVPLLEVKSAAWPVACAALVDAVTAGTLRHGNQPLLSDAFGAVRWGPTSASGGRAFLLRDSPGAGPAFAAARAVYALSGAAPSVYEDRGLLVF